MHPVNLVASLCMLKLLKENESQVLLRTHHVRRWGWRQAWHLPFPFPNGFLEENKNWMNEEIYYILIAKINIFLKYGDICISTYKATPLPRSVTVF
jgi:hypothetical protein